MEDKLLIVTMVNSQTGLEQYFIVKDKSQLNNFSSSKNELHVERIYMWLVQEFKLTLYPTVSNCKLVKSDKSYQFYFKTHILIVSQVVNVYYHDYVQFKQLLHIACHVIKSAQQCPHYVHIFFILLTKILSFFPEIILFILTQKKH